MPPQSLEGPRDIKAKLPPCGRFCCRRDPMAEWKRGGSALTGALSRRSSKLNFLNFGKKTSQRETLSRSAQETARLKVLRYAAPLNRRRLCSESAGGTIGLFLRLRKSGLEPAKAWPYPRPAHRRPTVQICGTLSAYTRARPSSAGHCRGRPTSEVVLRPARPAGVRTRIGARTFPARGLPVWDSWKTGRTIGVSARRAVSRQGHLRRATFG